MSKPSANPEDGPHVELESSSGGPNPRVEVLPYHGEASWATREGLVPRSGTPLGTQGAPIKELAPDREPWERQPRESIKAWVAFTRYRDMDAQERSLRFLAASLGKSLTLVGRWSRHWMWQERVALWEAHQERLARQVLVEKVRKVADQRLGVAEQLLGVLSSSLRTFGKEDLQKLRPFEIARLVQAAGGLADGVTRSIGQPEQATAPGGFEQLVLAMARRRVPPSEATD